MIYDDFEIEILADYLANSHDWDVGDERKDFINYAKDNDVLISESTLQIIFQKFQALDPIIKYNRTFDHKDFIRRCLQG